MTDLKTKLESFLKAFAFVNGFYIVRIHLTSTADVLPPSCQTIEFDAHEKLDIEMMLKRIRLLTKPVLTQFQRDFPFSLRLESFSPHHPSDVGTNGVDLPSFRFPDLHCSQQPVVRRWHRSLITTSENHSCTAFDCLIEGLFQALALLQFYVTDTRASSSPLGVVLSEIYHQVPCETAYNHNIDILMQTVSFLNREWTDGVCRQIQHYSNWETEWVTNLKFLDDLCGECIDLYNMFLPSILDDVNENIKAIRWLISKYSTPVQSSSTSRISIIEMECFFKSLLGRDKLRLLSGPSVFCTSKFGGSEHRLAETGERYHIVAILIYANGHFTMAYVNRLEQTKFFLYNAAGNGETIRMPLNAFKKLFESGGKAALFIYIREDTSNDD